MVRFPAKRPNNTTDNALLMTALGEQHITAPADVHLGETTLDEMCLRAFSLLYKVK